MEGSRCLGRWRPGLAGALFALLVAGGLGLTASQRVEAQPPPQAQERQERCLACHSLPDLALTLPSGERLPLAVDANALAASVHGRFSCGTCHGAKDYPHGPVSAPDRRGYTVTAAQLCLSCHQNAAYQYQGSVHGKAVAAGRAGAAVCTDCHSPHQMGKPPIAMEAVWSCRACHSQVTDSYRQSIHGRLMEAGRREAAVCVDCHSPESRAHSLMAVQAPDSPASTEEVPNTCGRCHAKALESYMTTFHGRAWRLGTSRKEATCIDCHGSYGIQPMHAPEAPVTQEKLAQTCAKCHGGATESFAAGWLGHEEPSPSHFPLAYYTERFLFFLTTVVVAFGILHVELDLLRWLIDKRRRSGR